MSGVSSESGGDIGITSQSKQGNDGVTAGRHGLGSLLLPNLGSIFIKGDIAHPMQTVLNRPVASPKRGGGWKGQMGSGQIGNGKSHLCSRPSCLRDAAGHLERLLNVRPIQELIDGTVSGQSQRSLDGALLDAPVALVDLGPRTYLRCLMFEEAGYITQEVGLVALDREEVVPPFCTICSHKSRWQ